MRISVIIPVLNEEPLISRHLQTLANISGLHEVIVVDGGSSDRTALRAQLCSGVRVISAPRGRATQMNAGARVATGDVFLFLHADVTLPVDATRRISHALANSSVVAGAFRTHTVADGQRTWIAPLLRLADIRSRVTRLPYGDQAIFVHREAFERIGGFPALPIMEDLELCRRLRRIGTIRTVPASVRVSGRRFTARPLLAIATVNVIPLLYRLGLPPKALARLYGNVR